MRDIDLGLIQFDHIKGLFRECRPRLLVVTDGSLNAGPGDFGLSRFVATLQQTTIHSMAPTVVTRARRTTNPDDAFDDLAISAFDVVFLFGINREGDALGQPALDRIKRFMQAGGGVFATGDHEDLGAGMSGDIPRVRAMRFWAPSETPNVANGTRLTTNLAGTDSIFEFGDQSDNLPQRLYADFAIPSDYPVLAPFPPNPSRVRQPHPLVKMADGSALDAYPDHPHEGECRLPTDFSTTFPLDGNTVTEWPNQWFFGRPRPRAVASTMSFGNGFDSGPTGPKDAVSPRAFISICAYNGQAAGVGRVVTDATWHHYVNVNLVGMLPNGVPTLDLQRIQRYWSNLANWLMPAATRKCLWPWFVLETLRVHPLLEEIRLPLDREPELDEIRALGAMLVSAADRVPGGVGQDLVADVVGAIVEPERLSEREDDLGISDVVVDAASAVIGAYVVEVARLAAAGKLEHDDDGFARFVERVSTPIVDAVVEKQRQDLKRRSRSVDVFAAAIRRRELANA